MGMFLLVLGLVLFLGGHSVRIVAEGWRARAIARLGDKGWKVLYSLVSFLGLGLLVWGFVLARQQPVVLWTPPRGMGHLAALLMLVSFVLLAAVYVPRNAIRARLGHPMILSIKTWAFAHLLANGTLADVVLFGAFLVWAVFDFRAARRREPVAADAMAATSGAATAATVVLGLAAWAVFAFWLHGWLIGVRPFGV